MDKYLKNFLILIEKIQPIKTSLSKLKFQNKPSQVRLYHKLMQIRKLMLRMKAILKLQDFNKKALPVHLPLHLTEEMIISLLLKAI